MPKALLLYSSREGQTTKVLQYIAEHLADFDCEIANLHETETVNFADYEKVLIGASIHYGHLNKGLYKFIHRYRDELAQNKAAFVCLNLTARKEEQQKDTPQGSPYVQTFLRKSPWQPELIGVFAGALRYPRYNVFDKFMIRLIMKMTGGETDTSKEIEYTNWNKVAKFAQQFASM